MACTLPARLLEALLAVHKLMREQRWWGFPPYPHPLISLPFSPHILLIAPCLIYKAFPNLLGSMGCQCMPPLGHHGQHTATPITFSLSLWKTPGGHLPMASQHCLHWTVWGLTALSQKIHRERYSEGSQEVEGRSSLALQVHIWGSNIFK